MKKTKRSQEEIDAEKDKLRAELEEVSLSDVIDQAESKGSRHYAREFKKIYNGVRKGLVLLQKKRTLKMIDNQKAYEDAQGLLNLFIEE